MPDTHSLLLFMFAGWLLNLTPGPDVLYIVTHSMRSGVKAGLVAGLGITTGCFVHVFAAALGLGALLATSAAAFVFVKLAGAAYLCWIGLKALLARAPEASAPKPAEAASLQAIYLGGFWTNVLNPKVAIFFLAFLPQFVAADADHKTVVFVALGLLFNFNAMPINAGYAWSAAWMARRPGVQRGMHWLEKAAGAMFIAFGVRLALSGRPAD
ncbi:LysE family translocator [Pelomonas sp. SE-A7]|uniref:LysE family translocator n=1 Tax=Pelomonas sp. SE-A7 TaxID=3054953 RepID=UPI00259D209B|nr:LysE family translocator [Pelomonas sp. SE-A7]MDM4764787.1 LysE family translocator [Pelomonas sp. SE-A7]